MKKRALHVGMAAVVMLVGLGTVVGSIVNSAHDFSGNVWSGGQICSPCHTPHNADTSTVDAPLWNHEVTEKTYTLYSSATMDATDLDQPSGVSRLCLSCHDGTVAIDSFGGSNGSTFILASRAIGSDGLANDHPIAFTYDSDLATADGELADPATALSGLGGTIDEDLLFNGKLECASCHDVHRTEIGSINSAALLRVNNIGSALCLKCHNK